MSSQTTDSAKLFGFHSAQEITGGSRKQPGAKDTDRQMIQEGKNNKLKSMSKGLSKSKPRGH